MFTVYKPKGNRISAVQLTPENALDVAKKYNGRVKTVVARHPGALAEILGIEVPSFEGAKFIPLKTWIVRDEEGFGFETMEDEKFTATYEPARKSTRE